MTHYAAQVWFIPACAAFVFAACTGADTTDSAIEPSDAVPAITAATVDCEEGSAEWSFSVVTDAWTGNGQVILTEDGEYVEKHAMFSTVSAADGTRDELALSLSVVPDWRDVALGSSTVFNCEAPQLTGIVRVWVRDGGTQADCRAFGAAPERWATWDVGATCDTILEPGE